ncbi:hypothetical protein AMELA_G00179850 [Ameiurus melas]|uniref:Uncharacterized protein n=1 Tax=Ameiurus melas TaxID=219545 RepID=A0A7J6A9Y4_AMEME|nr:hypothetical protein AMELA_G00179850 [Ameiurus melas]
MLGKNEVETAQSGHSAVEVSIHNRLQTYQLSAVPSPESAALLNQRVELCQVPCTSPVPSFPHQRPDTLIQCQQIVKVIVLDKGGHGGVEALLGQSPTHQLISSPQREKDGSQPPLPPPPPPYNHPHQYIPPDPRLTLHRTLSGSRSIV